MKAVSFRISGGNGLSRCPTRCCCSTSTSKLPTMTMPPSARMFSFPRLNWPGRHVALHDVDAVFLIEGNSGDLVEANHVILADQAALPGRIVDEHLGDRRFAAGNQMGVGRDLLEQSGSCRCRADRVRPGCSSARRMEPFGGATTLFARSSKRRRLKPIERSRKSIHSAVAKRCGAPSRRCPSTSDFDIWIGRSESIRKGVRLFPVR